MKLLLPLVILLASTVGPARADELPGLMTTPGELLLSEDFSAATIPPCFRTLHSPDRFVVVDGALQATAEARQERSTHGAFMVGGHNLTMAFSVKFTRPGTLYIGIDGYSERHQGNTHLVRFSLTPDQMGWDQKLGGAESKRAVSEATKAARKNKQRLPPPTAEQLADPDFFRTAALAAREIDCPQDQWHQVVLEVNGNDLVAQVNGQALVATATVADAKKNRIGVGLTGRGTVLLRDIRVWENLRREQWDTVKLTLDPPREAQD